jgi:hypothetical protein
MNANPLPFRADWTDRVPSGRTSSWYAHLASFGTEGNRRST